LMAVALPSRHNTKTAAMPSRPAPLLTRTFMLACLAALAAFSSFYLLLAALPLYVEKIGGDAADVGLVMGALSATAVLLRLWIGRAADGGRARALMVGGTLVMSGATLAYLFAGSVRLLLLLRIVHGAGWAAFGTAASTLVANVAPAERRGAAMGYYGMFSNLAMAVGPAIGEAIVMHGGFVELWLVTASVAALGVVLSTGVREPALPIAGEPAIGAALPLIEPTAVLPSAIYALLTTTYGAVVSFVPLYARQHGLSSSSFFFTAYAFTLLATRSFTGRLSDRYGRAAVIVPGILLAALGLAVLAVAERMPTFIAVAVLYGLAFAALQPALLALLTDRAPLGRRGAAMGTFTTAIDLGIFAGSWAGGWIVSAAGFPTMYVAASAVAMAALGLFAVTGRDLEPAGTRGAYRARPTQRTSAPSARQR
jgi:MFS family permease